MGESFLYICNDFTSYILKSSYSLSRPTSWQRTTIRKVKQWDEGEMKEMESKP